MLEIKNFSKSYSNDKIVVDDISLKVDNGDIFGFVGHNGAGKTTTIKSIVGILSFEKGDILIDGISIKDNPIACKKNIAYIPDNPDLYDHLKGIEYLNFIADVYGISVEKREELIKKYADIISALIHEPKLYILDEPFVGLDPKATHLLKEIMKEKCKEGCAFFFSTHILEVAEKLCNKIAIIKEGKIVISGEMKKIVKDKSLEDIFLELVNE